MGRGRLGTVFLGMVLVGCSEHVRPDSLVRPLAQEVTARGLGIEVPSTLAPGWPTRGPTVG